MTHAASLMLLAAGMAASAEPISAAEGQMTHENYKIYLSRFNSGDDRYAQFYDDNVVFDHGPFFGILKGRQAIVDFYRDIRTKVKETVTASTVVIDNEHGVMAAELSTQLVATRDGVEMPSGHLDKGDMIITRGTVYYGLKDGRIISIRGGITGATRIPANQK
ncbi:MAG TPA: nuclear transport factor 2 family protein [Sphingomonadaceae bacterium]|nr:nuclear transport factor 2 family protein [Sphingomonadaceae bacterium]